MPLDVQVRDQIDFDLLYELATTLTIYFTWWIEHKTCDIIAAERLQLMRFDNRIIIESLKLVCFSSESIVCHKTMRIQDILTNLYLVICSRKRKCCVVRLLVMEKPEQLQQASYDIKEKNTRYFDNFFILFDNLFQKIAQLIAIVFCCRANTINYEYN